MIYSLLIGEESVPVGDYTLKMFNQYLNSIKDSKKKNKLKRNFDSAVVSWEFDVKSVLNKFYDYISNTAAQEIFAKYNFQAGEK